MNQEFPPITIRNNNLATWYKSVPEAKSPLRDGYSSGRNHSQEPRQGLQWYSDAKKSEGQRSRSTFRAVRVGTGSLTNSLIPLTYDHQVALCYQRVQLFLWYRPRNLVCIQDNKSEKTDLSSAGKAPCPFEGDSHPVISEGNRLRGYGPSLSDSLLVPMTTDQKSEILPSCLIKDPYTLDLMTLNEVSQIF